MGTDKDNDRYRSTGLIIFTWLIVLLVSDLPNAIWQALIGEPPGWLITAKFGLLIALLLVSLAWKPLQIVRSFLFLLLVLMLALWGMRSLMATSAYNQWQKQIGWIWAMAAFQLLKFMVAFIMIISLLLLGRRKEEFFLSRGQINAPIKPASSDKPGKRLMTWAQLGLILGLSILPLTFLFFAMGSLPSVENLTKVLPFFPIAILFAITNSFSEEMQFRASLLGDLEKAVGHSHAIWITATFFGFAHYFGGDPSGIAGVIIAGLLGALFALTMLGSRSILVPWFIHFCQNAVIFAFELLFAMT